MEQRMLSAEWGVPLKVDSNADRAYQRGRIGTLANGLCVFHRDVAPDILRYYKGVGMAYLLEPAAIEMLKREGVQEIHFHRTGTDVLRVAMISQFNPYKVFDGGPRGQERRQLFLEEDEWGTVTLYYEDAPAFDEGPR